MKVKESVKSNVNTTRVVVKNFVEFLDAACLTIVAAFTLYQARTNGDLKTVYSWILTFASVVIALQAFVLLVRHFNKESK